MRTARLGEGIFIRTAIVKEVGKWFFVFDWRMRLRKPESVNRLF